MSKVYNNGPCIKMIEYICHKTYGIGCLGCKIGKSYSTGYQEAKKQYEKSNKALEIIKNKKVNILGIIKSKNLNDYNKSVITKDRTLTKQEYDLVKEVIL